MKDRYNFAVIGCGALARYAHIPNIVKSPRMVLHTCCDVSQEALAECRSQFGALHTTSDFHAAINDPEVDVICLATTEKLRLPVIAAAAKAGKPIYIEKPVARTLKEMYEIQKVIRESGIPACVGHNRRSSPAMIEAHRIFRSHMANPKQAPWRWDREGADRPKLPSDGVAGMTVRINDDWWSWKSWVFDKEQAPEGQMLFEMTHYTDMCNWFLDAQPQQVVALERGQLNSGVVIAYKTGEMATLSMYANGTFGYPKELYEMFGQGGAVIVDHMTEIRTAGIPGVPDRIPFPFLKDRHPNVGTEGGIYGWLAKKRAACAEAEQKGDPMLAFAAEPDKGHAHAMERFLDEILGKGPKVCPIDDAVLATRVAFAAIQSVKTGRAVNMDEV
ncbi:MAG: Gfo/Idh/MocA family oxidoreductase [Phycisphaerales bacterium]|jgi:predicted dehydrogenase|nr:Gfo/Idh/MocA family oxidoreductase [Phycisphaerales bacterium]